MAETVADFPVEPLIEWWVSRIYGYPGDGINGITTALRRGATAATSCVQLQEGDQRLSICLRGWACNGRGSYRKRWREQVQRTMG
jgi:hypothetical protein